MPKSPKTATPAKKPVPVSEDQQRFRPDWTAQDCIAELQRIVNIDTTKIVSRNYFRNHASCSESTWNQFFGTFAEFKRQAGIVLSRQQHNLEKQVAKQASVDHYRAMNIERQAYAGKYEHKQQGRHKVVMIVSDLHDKLCDPFYLRVMVDTARRVQPDIVNFNGDIFDLPEFGRYTVDPRGWDVTGRIRFVHENILRPMREACPDAQFDFNEGNHEFRLIRHLGDATPAMRAVLAELHGMTIGKLLGLDEFEINYIAKADLAAYTISNIREEIAKNYSVYFGALVAHHFPEGRALGMPGVNGHHHKFEAYALHNELFGAYSWIQGGSGHMKDASYANGDKWQLGFTLAHVQTDRRQVNFEYIPITDMAVVGGDFYYREPDEYISRADGVTAS